MIDWKSTAEYKPERDVNYLVYMLPHDSGHYEDKVDLTLVAAYFPEYGEWRTIERQRYIPAEYITHFAEITLPVRVTNES